MNNCSFLGRITRDIELKVLGATSVAKFGLAVNRKFKKGEADFINIVAFGKTAETLNQYCKKGDLIALECRVQTGSYDNKEGKKVYTTDFIVDSFHFAGNSGPKQENSNTNNGSFEEDMTPVYDEDMPF